jgi:hypothetical protein
MTTIARERYDVFDIQRRQQEAHKADADDLKELETLEQQLNKRTT